MVGGTVVGVVVWGGELPLVAPWFGGDPLVLDVVGGRVVADAPGMAPRETGADFVWKVRTPASPAAVAAITMGVRLIELLQLEWTPGSIPQYLEGKRFVMDVVTMYSELLRRHHDPLAKPFRTTDVDVAARDVWFESLEHTGIEADLFARADNLVEPTTSLLDEVNDLVAVDDLLRRGRSNNDRDIHPRR